jgi:hypothetical protein
MEHFVMFHFFSLFSMEDLENTDLISILCFPMKYDLFGSIQGDD